MRHIGAIARACALVIWTLIVFTILICGARLAFRNRSQWRALGFHKWARGAARILNLRILVSGSLPIPPFLLVSNHLSYVDVVVYAPRQLTIVDIGFCTGQMRNVWYSAQRIMQAAFETLRPEAAYFYPGEEGRTILLFIDVKDPSDMPVIGDPFFKGFNARVTFTPVMNAQDFQAGMAKLAQRS